MRVLVAAMGSRGDVQPVIALGLALRASGHDVTVSVPPDFEAWVQGLGFRFTSCGDSVEKVLAAHSRHMATLSRRQLLRALHDILVQNLPEVTQRTIEASRGADVMVCASHFAARSTAEFLGIPYIGVVYAPIVVRSRHHPPMGARYFGLPQFINPLVWTLIDRVATRVFLEPVNTERKRLGLQPARSFNEHFYSSAPIILACDPVVGPSPPDWSDRDITTTGPWYYEDPASLNPEVEAFLNDGPAPVFVGFGSMVSADAQAATRAIVAATGASGKRVLIAQGWAGLGTGARSSSVMVASGSIPHSKLFPRVSVVVHHGGAGTTATALRAGVPQVVVPHVVDQFYFAHRLKVLGIAPPPIPIGKFSAGKLARAIDEALALPPGPRNEAAGRLKNGEGVQRTVALIESRLGSTGRSLHDQ